ncbi:MAG: hypothetical protein IKY70_02260, partial [Bacteroidales bacterium]|nr:hypothetical protein [Bacteroidales bacterium]
MRHLSFFIILCLSVTACTDNAYDLSKLDTDENSVVVIGNDNSEFRMPLATIRFTVERFIMAGQKEEVSIDEFMKKVDIWRPSNLPDNRDFIELGRLMEDSDYMNSIITALVDEMNSNQQKREEVCNLIAKDYRGDLLDLLEGKIPDQILSPIYNLTDEEAGNILATLYVTFNDAV